MYVSMHDVIKKLGSCMVKLLGRGDCLLMQVLEKRHGA